MRDEIKDKVDRVASQSREEIQRLAFRAEAEIQQIVEDSKSAFETIFGKKPNSRDVLMFYDNSIISLIEDILSIRETKKNSILGEKGEEKP